MADTHRIPADPTNADALQAWDGGDGELWARYQDRFDATLAPHNQRLFEAARIGAQERVLDIGCGNGQTTRDAARAAASGSALGVDLSSQMLAQARARVEAEGLSNVEFVHADAQIYPFTADEFDLAISRTGVMFFGDPVRAFSNIARALKPSGRVALLVWQSLSENDWLHGFLDALSAGRERPTPPPDAPGPFALADPERVRRIFSSAGFADVRFDDVREPMWFGSDTDDAYNFTREQGFVRGMLEDADDATRTRALEALRASISAHDTGSDGVLYNSAAWIIHAHRA